MDKCKSFIEILSVYVIEYKLIIVAVPWRRNVWVSTVNQQRERPMRVRRDVACYVYNSL